VRYIDKTGVEMLCVVLPNNQDPMEFLRDHGADALRPILEAAQPLMDFVFGKRLAGYDLSVPGRRVAALDDMAQVLAPLADSMLMDGYATQLADMLGFDVDRVRQVIRDKAAAARRKEAERSRMEAQQPQPQSQSQWQGDRQAAAPQQAAQGGGGEGRALPAAALSTDERMQSVAERELLSMIATHPDVMRQHGDRIATFTWSDSRFEAMAWAMLATPAGTPPAEVVGAATDVVADAPRILAGGRLEVTSRMPVEQRADFLLDVVELWSKRREVREIKARLRMSSSSVPDDQARGLFRTATELQKRINELSNRVSAVA
jgi:DNA primase